MPSDQKDVTQRPIRMLYQGDGPFRTVRDISIPEPPDGCESQQLFDWALLIAVITSSMPMHGKMRLVEAYCDRHPQVGTEEWTGPWPPPPEERL